MVVLLFDMGWVEPPRDGVFWAETFLKWPHPLPYSAEPSGSGPLQGHTSFPGTFSGTKGGSVRLLQESATEACGHPAAMRCLLQRKLSTVAHI